MSEKKEFWTIGMESNRLFLQDKEGKVIFFDDELKAAAQAAQMAALSISMNAGPVGDEYKVLDREGTERAINDMLCFINERRI